jgi:hypothetical protein
MNAPLVISPPCSTIEGSIGDNVSGYRATEGITNRPTTGDASPRSTSSSRACMILEIGFMARKKAGAQQIYGHAS